MIFRWKMVGEYGMLIGGRWLGEPGFAVCMTCKKKESLCQKSLDVGYEMDEEDQMYLQDELGR